jgi:hypothetical protein
VTSARFSLASDFGRATLIIAAAAITPRSFDTAFSQVCPLYDFVRISPYLFRAPAGYSRCSAFAISASHADFFNGGSALP